MNSPRLSNLMIALPQFLDCVRNQGFGYHHIERLDYWLRQLFSCKVIHNSSAGKFLWFRELEASRTPLIVSKRQKIGYFSGMARMTTTEYAIEGSNYRVVDRDGYRYLMQQDDESTAHSIMKIEASDALVSAYTISMMSLLVFMPEPRDMVMIGLGGGQQVKFAHKRMPGTRIVAVEIDPRMVDISRTYFGLPADDARLSVVVGDGRAYIESHPQSCDVILSDGYDHAYKISESLAHEDFYRCCHRALRAQGMMALNLYLQDDAWCDAHLRMLRRIFPAVLTIPVIENQRVLILFKDLRKLVWADLSERAARLEERLGLDLPAFVLRLRESMESA
ncbi:MAG: spermidine synthase [Burkholderia sp.]|nr:spermidine synthase [Burkholderia sp.]